MHGEKENDGDEDEGNRDNLLEGSWNSLLPATQRLDKVEQKATQMAMTMTMAMAMATFDDDGNSRGNMKHLQAM